MNLWDIVKIAAVLILSFTIIRSAMIVTSDRVYHLASKRIVMKKHVFTLVICYGLFWLITLT